MRLRAGQAVLPYKKEDQIILLFVHMPDYLDDSTEILNLQ